MQEAYCMMDHPPAMRHLLAFRMGGRPLDRSRFGPTALNDAYCRPVGGLAEVYPDREAVRGRGRYLAVFRIRARSAKAPRQVPVHQPQAPKRSGSTSVVMA